MSDGARTTTSTALLERLLNPADEAVWREFDVHIRPVIESFAGRLGLESADAADVAQETMAQFVKDYRAGKYDRRRGRLRAWIIGIARHRIAEQVRRQAARREYRGTSAMMHLADEDQLADAWDAECREAMVCHAMRELSRGGRISARTIEAFRLHVIEQRPPTQVAGELGTTVRAVYLAKHRCLGRLRELMEGLKEIYDVA